MQCPHCGKTDDKVLESRQNSTGSIIRRRRECLNCSYRFTSYEKIEEKPLMIVKRDGERELFSKEKLQKGIYTAIRKRDIPAETVDSMLADIEDVAEYHGKTTHEISSSLLGDLVIEKLKEMDDIAYIRYVSVYKNFQNTDEFIKEIKEIKAPNKKGKKDVK